MEIEKEKELKYLIFISFLGICAWFFHTVFIWTAFLFGKGYILIYYDFFGEMFFELFLITLILILMIYFTIYLMKNINTIIKNDKH